MASFKLRAGSSGPVVMGTPGDVLTIDPSGDTVSPQPAGGGGGVIQFVGAVGHLTELSPGQIGSVDVVWEGIAAREPTVLWAGWAEAPLATLALLDAYLLSGDTVRVRFLASASVLGATVVINIAALPGDT